MAYMVETKMVVIVKNRDVYNEYLKRFGLSIAVSSLRGDLPYGPLPTPSISTPEMHHAYKMVLGLREARYKGIEISMYLGNLDPDIIEYLKHLKFDINQYNVLQIINPVYSKYRQLVEITKTSTSEELVEVASTLLDFWPKTKITTTVDWYDGLDFLEWTPRFDYGNTERKFHAVVPAPITGLDAPIDCKVLIEPKETPTDSIYTYSFVVANKYLIHCDEYPTSTNVHRLVLDTISYGYKFDRVIKKLFKIINKRGSIW